MTGFVVQGHIVFHNMPSLKFAPDLNKSGPKAFYSLLHFGHTYHDFLVQRFYFN